MCAQLKRGKTFAHEKARGAHVVHGASEPMLSLREHAVDEYAIGARTRHHGEIARALTLWCFAGHAAQRNGTRFKPKLLAHGFGGVEREAEMTREGIGASERNNANDGRRMMREPLNNLVQGA